VGEKQTFRSSSQGGRLHTKDQGVVYSYEQRLLGVQHALRLSIKSRFDEDMKKERFEEDIERFSKVC
jgi:hypothetical protein